jgi:predicted ATPase
MDKLSKIIVGGFKSFRKGDFTRLDGGELVSQDIPIEFGDLTVLLGANGAGKSNLVSFFKLLNSLASGTFQEYVGRAGGAGALLHYGAQVTPSMHFQTLFAGEGRQIEYSAGLAYAPPDKLVITSEVLSLDTEGELLQERYVGHGFFESELEHGAASGNPACGTIRDLLSRCRIYQFHDTSPTARVRGEGYVEDAGFLREDAGNLAAYLFTLRETKRRYYDRIVETIRQVFPQFGDFVLELRPLNQHNTILNWRERNRPEYLFGPHQVSDGTLRFMALATLFMQPPERLPSVVVIDEPELGLHPYAITVLAGIIKAASSNCQVILSTQSTRLVDEFDVDQIVVVERDDKDNCTRTHRPDAKALEDWIQRYTTSELWEKNVLGGRP